jgi:hypothetical protein
MSELLWVVIIFLGIGALFFLLDLLGVAGFIFSSMRDKKK